MLSIRFTYVARMHQWWPEMILWNQLDTKLTFSVDPWNDNTVGKFYFSGYLISILFKILFRQIRHQVSLIPHDLRHRWSASIVDVSCRRFGGWLGLVGVVGWLGFSRQVLWRAFGKKFCYISRLSVDPVYILLGWNFIYEILIWIVFRPQASHVFSRSLSKWLMFNRNINYT